MIIDCPICQKGKVFPLKTIKGYRINKYYTLYQCNDCKSQSFDLNEHRDIDLINYYNLASQDEGYLNNKFKFSKYWINEIKCIENIFGRIPNSVLDIGCRTGDFLMHFPQEIEKMGVELSEYSAKIAKERGLKIEKCYIENFKTSNKYDLITAYAIIEHLAKPQLFLNKITDLINNKGILVIMIPSYQTIKAKLINLSNVQWHMYSPPGHLSLYSKMFLDNYLNDKGFKLVKRRYTSGGMFNPFKKIPLIGRLFSKFMWILDAYSPLNRFPIFDHMYSYYIKEK